MDFKQCEAAVEAVLFASGDPVPADRLSEATGVDVDTINKVCLAIKERYDDPQYGIMLMELDDSFQLVTKPQFAETIKTALQIKKNQPLSQAAMEVLAIIAYNQPVSKSFVEQVRGVDSSQIVNNLVEKGLVEEAGRLDIPGKPISYRTTVHFLRCFGLKSLENLPPLPDENGQVMLEEVVEENASLQEDRSDG